MQFIQSWQRISILGATCVLFLDFAGNFTMAVDPINPSPGPAPCSKVLEQAATALAANRLEEARLGFQQVAEDTNLPPIVRSLAMFGLTQSALSRQDQDGALRTLGTMVADNSLPSFHRDNARRWIGELERRQRGLPARNPANYQVQLPVLGETEVIFHIAPTGDLVGDGSPAKPFRTLQQARDAIRGLKKAGENKLPKGGVRVIIHGGVYPVQGTLNFMADDSGTADAPIVYQAKPGEFPIFQGGVRITGWRPISDPRVRAKLNPTVRDRVLAADLAQQGIKDWGDATDLRQRPELFCDGAPQTLARWPNDGFVKTGEILGTNTFKVWGSIPGCKDGKFRYAEDRPSAWVDEPEVRLYGYWFWDWYEEYQKVASLDPGSHAMTLAKPYSVYGYRKDQRYYAVNVFRELDQPGEWYLDRHTGLIYWLPPTDTEAQQATTTLSVFAQPFITMAGAQHVILLGLTFEAGRGDAIHIRGGADCLVAGCTVREFGGDAIVVDGGAHHGVFGCAIHTMGCGGINIKGGDRATLTAGNHFVENCVVFDISRLKHTYTPAVLLDGCGNRIAHNLFERIPSSALRIEGNDQLVELNRIRNVVQESDDQGGIDMFGNPLYRGNVIRWNHWSDITGGTQCGAAGVRLDDMISGVAVYGNVFERCGAVLFGGVQIHGGKDNCVDGNLFLNSFAGISYSRWGEKRWLEQVQPFLQQAAAPTYAQRYPELIRLKQACDVNYISRNIFAHCQSIFMRDGGVEQTALNLVTPQIIDASRVSDEAAFHQDPQLRRLLFEPIPVLEIGPYAHSWRAMK